MYVLHVPSKRGVGTWVGLIIEVMNILIIQCIYNSVAILNDKHAFYVLSCDVNIPFLYDGAPFYTSVNTAQVSYRIAS